MMAKLAYTIATLTRLTNAIVPPANELCMAKRITVIAALNRIELCAKVMLLKDEFVFMGFLLKWNTLFLNQWLKYIAFVDDNYRGGELQ